MSSKNNRFNQQNNTNKDSYKETAVDLVRVEAKTVDETPVEAKETSVESETPIVHHPKQDTPAVLSKTIPSINQVQNVNQPTPKMLPVQTELLTLSQALNPNKPVDGRWQYTLLDLIRSSIEKEQPEGFDKVWNAILMFFHRSKGTVFSELHILRMGDNWPGSDNDFSLYRRLIHVITETAAPETRRQVVKRINLSLATTHLSETGRNRLISYYE